MEGFEGYKPDEAIANLNDFSANVLNIYNYAKEQVAIYNSNLVENWCSSTAYDLDNCMSQPTLIAVYLLHMKHRVMNKAISAYKVIAKYHGASFEYVDEIDGYPINYDISDDVGFMDDGGNYFYADRYPWEHLKKSSSKHGIGMNKDNVRIIVDELKKAGKKIEDDLDSLPMNFAGYDENNEIKESYKLLISDAKRDIMDAIEGTIYMIEKCYETESNNVSMGSKLAVEKLHA